MSPSSRKPGRPPASEQSIPTEAKILSVAESLFVTHGFDSVTTEQIADQCNLTKAMVYYYFSSKTQLFTTAIVNMMERIRKRTLAILNEPEPFYDRLYRVTLARLRVNTKLDMDLLLKGGASQLSDDQIALIHQSEERLVTAIADVFEKAACNGEIHVNDAQFAVRVYMSLLSSGLISQYDDWSAEKKANEILRIFFDGIK